MGCCADCSTSALAGVPAASVPIATPFSVGMLAAAAGGYAGSKYLRNPGVGFGVGALLGLVVGAFAGNLIQGAKP